MSGHSNKERLSRLERRADFLATRIKESENRGQNVDYDKSEESALRWAIEIVQLHYNNVQKGVEGTKG